jgi:chromosome segregation ATPase
MKYLKFSFTVLLIALVLTANILAQKPASKTKRPVKNPPQYPHILETGEAKPQPGQTEGENAAPAPNTPLSQMSQQDLLLIKAVISLTTEVRGLVTEMKSLNVRQQAQLDMLRLTRSDLRSDQYERELKTVRDRLTALDAEEQNLQVYLTPDSLNAQVATIPTLDKSTTIRQLKANHEARLHVVQTEKELVQQRLAELVTVLDSFRASGSDAEKRIQAAEEILKKLEDATSEAQSKAKEPLPEKP